MGERTGPLQTCRIWVDRVLMVNVFVVMAGALWFVVAVGLHGQGLEQPLGALSTALDTPVHARHWPAHGSGTPQWRPAVVVASQDEA